jgi:hypothetical protein
MKYADGQEVRLGDKVKLGTDSEGVVVFSIDTGEYSKDYPESEWRYLKNGIMVQSSKYGLIHYKEPQEDLELIERGKN